jgi:arylsulfatase A-like enzyme
VRILYLDLDTLRPDHLGCYGYHRETSPNIDGVARAGVRFDNYYCSDAPCLPSRAALTTGRFGIHTGVVNHGGLCADLRPEGAPRGFRDQLQWGSLAGYLRREVGLHTASFSPFADRHSAWWFNAGFCETHDVAGKGGNESAEEITPQALDWIERNAARDNWFLHVNYWDPHTPYRAPAAFGNPFADAPLPAWLTDDVWQQHLRCVGPHGAHEVSMYDAKEDPRFPRQPGAVTTREKLRQLFDGYDCGIRYMDTHIGMLFDALRRQGVFDDLYIIISSDHGENMGELGIYAEHGTADQATCRIPMIVRGPGIRRGHVDRGLHYNLDLAPTLADMFGKKPQAQWDGASYAAALRDGADCGRPYLVLSQCAHVCQRSVRFGDHLYLRTLHDGYHLFPDEMLFDLARDPHEQHNLAASQPAVCHQARALLGDWHEAMLRGMSHEDPLWQVLREGGPFHAKGRLRAYCAYLEQTGRAAAIPELKRRHPREFAGG